VDDAVAAAKSGAVRIHVTQVAYHTLTGNTVEVRRGTRFAREQAQVGTGRDECTGDVRTEKSGGAGEENLQAVYPNTTGAPSEAHQLCISSDEERSAMRH
jgi:hypothetical protein